MATLPQHHDRRRGTRVWSDSDGRGSGGTVYWGAYSGRRYPGRIAMGGPNWTVYPCPKNQPYHNQPSGASECSANRPGDGTAACLWRRKLGGIFDSWGGRRHGQLVTGRSISMVTPALTPKTHHNQPRFGSVGAESPRERRSGCVLWRAFFRNYGQRGGLRHL